MWNYYIKGMIFARSSYKGKLIIASRVSEKCYDTLETNSILDFHDKNRRDPFKVMRKIFDHISHLLSKYILFYDIYYDDIYNNNIYITL